MVLSLARYVPSEISLYAMEEGEGVWVLVLT